MIPQLTVYTKILYLLMVVIAGSLCSREQVHLYSKCANRFVGMHEGKIIANDDPVTSQTISISDQMSRGSIILGPLKLTLFIEEAKMYLCFNKKWRLVPSKKLHEYCYFYENMEEGYHRFKSVTDDTKHIGFTANGRQMTFRNRTIHNENCYSFTKITPKQLKASKTAMSSSISTSSAKPKVTYMGSPLNGMPVGESQHQNHHHHHHQKQQQQHRQQPRNKQHPQQQQQQHHKKQRHQRISKSSIISSVSSVNRTNKNKTQINLVSNHHHQYHQQQQQQQHHPHNHQEKQQQQQLHHRHRHSQNKHQLSFHDQTSSPSKNHNFQSDQSEQNSADIVEQRIRAERTFRDNMHSVRRSHSNYHGTHNSRSYHYLQKVDVAMDEMPTHHQHQLSNEMAAVAEAFTADRSLFTTTPATTTTTTTEIDTTNAMNVVPNKKEFRIKKKSHLDKHLGNTQKLNEPYTTMHRHRHHHGDYQSLTSAQYVDKMSKHSKRIHHRRLDDLLNRSSDPVRSV
ncbi:myb-like protein Q [Contarinia nasturtii]|uniref:myb-like protein Q n=1 Tax=Contarinia nasturtii TaxID=265458 RepID=UPI0012D3CCF3|nr:myb-like protein Q [Contarinia nasturtii]XP_031633099.1 myb-like protein Q [Contarinia nasturtii]XP_031633100.1 myb-like protein Q [Contarinia nasturtii]XP_031633101.1 myb-like protein Q [Contarinia nasturtii]XP_031633102.1 myb-like protein Q [Contarinia nasturtii]